MYFVLLYALRKGVIVVENDILRLIYDYSINGRIADFKFIGNLIDIVVMNKGLNNYISGINFSNE